MSMPTYTSLHRARGAGAVMTDFSVIIATRNRPALFAEALASVLMQSKPANEIIIVNDGSAEEHMPAYRATLAQAGNRIQLHSLVPRARGHGQSYSLNFGVSHASSTYVCFLDDDDVWTDKEHLARASAAIDNEPETIDLYLGNQAAFLKNERKSKSTWIEDLDTILQSEGRRSNACGVYEVSIEDLLKPHGFCHLNTLIVRRAYYEKIGGMDEGIRWECDRDLYFRLIDQAQGMLHYPGYVSRHNIPDPGKKDNMTTVLSDVERRLIQLRVFDKIAVFTHDPRIKAYGRRNKGFTLKKLTEALAAAGRVGDAAFYAREAQAVLPTLKWSAYSTWLACSSLFANKR